MTNKWLNIVRSESHIHNTMCNNNLIAEMWNSFLLMCMLFKFILLFSHSLYATHFQSPSYKILTILDILGWQAAVTGWGKTKSLISS